MCFIITVSRLSDRSPKLEQEILYLNTFQT